MASQRDEGRFEMAKKTLLKVAVKVWRQITLQCLEKSLRIDAKVAAVVEANIEFVKILPVAKVYNK